MAERVSAPVERVPPGGVFEKAGNTSWVRCAKCEGWFHVANQMLDTEGARMHCPHCHEEFTAGEAGRIVRAG